MNIQKILDERKKTHGDFAIHSKISQGLKDCLHYTDGWSNLTSIQREALEMICHKMARILAGDAKYKDHYVDIAGYASLMIDPTPVEDDTAEDKQFFNHVDKLTEYQKDKELKLTDPAPAENNPTMGY